MSDQLNSNKPMSIARAIALLWLSIGLGLVKIPLDLAHLRTLASIEFTVIVIVLTMAVIAFLILKISRGRNWARITFLVLFVIGVLPAVPLVHAEFSRSIILGMVSTLQIGFQVYALFLVFTKPGSSWFRQSAAYAR
jgi:hypothetical protein